MALRGTLTHRKTRRLAKLLGISPCFALGVLEALWHYAGEQKPPNGDLSSLSPTDLADELFYDDEPERLVWALQEAGWLTTEVPGVALYVKGWHEHADNEVRMRLLSMRQTFANGDSPRPNIHLRIPGSSVATRRRDRMLAAGGAKIPARTRKGVFARDGRICASCGSLRDLTLDHVMAISRGGDHAVENLRVLCRSCNSRKGVKEAFSG